MCFHVRVIDGEGEPVEGAKVTAMLARPWDGGEIVSLTDEYGDARFQTPGPLNDVRLYVRDERVGSFHLQDGASVTLTF